MKWLSTVKQAEEGKLVLERMELDEIGFPQPTGELEELEADALVLALGQETDLRCSKACRGSRWRTASSGSVPNLMTGDPGIFAGGDMVPAERTVTVGVGHGKQAARTSTPGSAARQRRERAGARARSVRAAEHLVLHGRSALDAAAARARAPPSPHSRRSSAGSTRRRPSTRRGAASPAATASPATTATASAPTTRCSSSGGEDEPLRVRLRLLQGLRDLRRGVPVRRDRDGARGDLRRERRRGIEP